MGAKRQIFQKLNTSYTSPTTHGTGVGNTDGQGTNVNVEEGVSSFNKCNLTLEQDDFEAVNSKPSADILQERDSVKELAGNDEEEGPQPEEATNASSVNKAPINPHDNFEVQSQKEVEEPILVAELQKAKKWKRLSKTGREEADQVV
ncbi:hypothetical protein RIF29_11741 [Crotalaria pallida]|uniref:Uncharacterized protein n=1 Tax=Crotalaria pallida TaxID=3830 RepID=A0AAN9IMH6_CROPI